MISKNAANIITALRIVLSLILFATEPFSAVFVTLYVLCCLSDIADGFVARHYKITGKFGEILDSIADMVFFTVCVVKFLPYIELTLFLIIIVSSVLSIRLLNIVISLFRYRKVLFLHTVLNKITGIILVFYPLSYALSFSHYFLIAVSVTALIASVNETYKLIKQK